MKNKSKNLLSQEAQRYLSGSGIIYEVYNKGIQINFPHQGVIYSWYPTTGKLLKSGKEMIIDPKEDKTVYQWISEFVLKEPQPQEMQREAIL